VIVGREPEQEHIGALLDGAREGRSGVLVLRGEAGIGKTALLESAREQAGEMTVLRCTGVESERELPCAALHQLVRPCLGLLDRLPEPQAAALRGAFGLSFERVEDRFLTSLGLLSLLAEAAEEAPVLCLIDDAHWLDRTSADALVFAARRLDVEPVAMLIASRHTEEQRFEGPGLPDLTLAGVSDEDAVGLIGMRSTVPVDPESLIRTARGNPLALLELPAGTGSVEDAFRQRIAALPRESRRMMLLAAAGDTEGVSVLGRAAERLGLDLSALEPAQRDDLVKVADSVSFRHPMVRSGAYAAATREEQREVHEALAAVLDGDSDDRMRRAWHRAEGLQGSSDDVAAELEAAADRATGRGAHAEAASALERAADLVEDRTRRGHLLQRAARAALDSGRREQALSLVDQARPSVTDPRDRTGLEEVRAAVEIHRGTPDEANAILMGAAELIAGVDPERATRMLVTAVEVAAIGGWPERAFVSARRALAGIESRGSAEEEFMRAFIEGVGALAELDPRAARERLADAMRHGRGLGESHALIWQGGVYMYAGDFPRGRSLYTQAVDAARATGSFHDIPMALWFCANADMAGRKVAAVEASAAEGIEIAQQVGQQNLETCFLAFLARVAAFRGREKQCRELAEQALGRALAHNLGSAINTARTALAEIGDVEAALAQLAYLEGDTAQMSLLVLSLPDLVDAAVRAGVPERTAPGLALYEVYAAQAQGPALGILARCKAQVAIDPEGAERLFQESLALQAHGAQPFERARTEIAYGEFLRRTRRRVDARVQLRAALATFEDVGAELWAARAREELSATGETTRKRDDSTRDELTPQELRIAQRVAEGASNREVAAQLFISPKTVEYHLSKVFMKVGVSSRMELARAGVPQG
jgi:DNA-binding CsgD family transcriptional regulator